MAIKERFIVVDYHSVFYNVLEKKIKVSCLDNFFFKFFRWGNIMDSQTLSYKISVIHRIKLYKTIKERYEDINTSRCVDYIWDATVYQVYDDMEISIKNKLREDMWQR